MSIIKYSEHKITNERKLDLFERYRIKDSVTIHNPFYFKYKNSFLCIDKQHKDLLDAGIKGVANKFDFVFAMTGMEGSAKSSLTILSMCYIAYVLGIEFDETDICLSLEQFEGKLNNSLIGEMISLDEFVLMGASEDTMTSLQKILRKKFTLIRKKRLFIFLVMPSIHMMNKYFAIERIRGLINCKVNNFQRGFADFYGYNKKNFLAVAGRKNFSYSGFKKDGSFNFIDIQDINIVKEHVINWEAYEKRKDDALKQLDEVRDESLNEDGQLKNKERIYKYVADKFKLIDYLHITQGKTWNEIGGILKTKPDNAKKFYFAWNENKDIKRIVLEDNRYTKEVEVCI